VFIPRTECWRENAGNCLPYASSLLLIHIEEKMTTALSLFELNPNWKVAWFVAIIKVKNIITNISCDIKSKETNFLFTRSLAEL
jgi:hypothetical protein